MAAVGSMNRVAGVYRSDCCGIERTVPAMEKFPACANPRSYCCKKSNADWILVRRIAPVSQRVFLPRRDV